MSSSKQTHDHATIKAWAAEHGGVPESLEQQEHQHEMGGEAHPGNEGCRHAGDDEIFRAGVEKAEQDAGGENEQDRRKRRGSIVRGVQGKGSEGRDGS